MASSVGGENMVYVVEQRENMICKELFCSVMTRGGVDDGNKHRSSLTMDHHHWLPTIFSNLFRFFSYVFLQIVRSILARSLPVAHSFSRFLLDWLGL